MTLTRSQIHERLGSLSGEIKAAREQKRLTAEDLANRQHEVTLAAQADEKASANVARLEQEARDLAMQYANEVDKLVGLTASDEQTAGEAFDEAVSSERGFAVLGVASAMSREEAEAELARANETDRFPYHSVFTEPADFQAQALQNGEARMNAAFDEATR